jgi:repressor LexA
MILVPRRCHAIPAQRASRTAVQYGAEVAPRLTKRQELLLGIIRDHINTVGWPPSVREILRQGPWESTSSVAHQLRQLELKGYIKRGDGPRQIHIVDQG